jgi:hypothetical protein
MPRPAVLSPLILPFPGRRLEDTNLISTLKDVQTYDILHRIDDQEEQLHLYAAHKDQQEIRPFLGQFIGTCESHNGQTYGNGRLSTHMQNYLDQTIENYLTISKPQAGRKNSEYVMGYFNK